MEIVLETLLKTIIFLLVFTKVFCTNIFPPQTTQNNITFNGRSGDIIPRDLAATNADSKPFTGSTRITKLQPVTSNYRSASSVSTMRLTRLTPMVIRPSYAVPKKVDTKKDPDGDDIFKQLENELNDYWNSTHTSNFQTEEEEAEESEKIFSSLIGEIENPKSAVALTKGTEKDREMLHRVTEAIARLTLKGKSSKSGNNGNVLAIVSDFFRSQLQYRS